LLNLDNDTRDAHAEGRQKRMLWWASLILPFLAMIVYSALLALHGGQVAEQARLKSAAARGALRPVPRRCNFSVR